MKLLVGVDLSEAMDTIFDHTKALAKKLSAEVWLVHVVDPDPDFVGFDAGPQTVRDALSKKYHEKHSQLQQAADELRSEGLHTTALLLQGPTVETLLKEAADLDVDMIVVGSHGRGAMSQLLLGSVSKGILHSTQRQVLVIPTRKHD